MRILIALLLVLLFTGSAAYSADSSASVHHSGVDIEYNRAAADPAGWTGEGDYGSVADEAAARPYIEARLNDLKVKAEQGNPEAQYVLATAYDAGTIIPQNYAKAYFWSSLAARIHPKWWTLEQRAETAKHLTPKQIAAVDKRVAEWKPTPAPAARTANTVPSNARTPHER